MRLADGGVLPAGLVVLAAGTARRLASPQRAGLDVERGIVVGDDLASPADPRVSAIGDCAETPEGGVGLVAPGWAQARRARARSPSRPPRPTTSPCRSSAPTRQVKAVGLDVVTMGVRASPPPSVTGS